MCTLSRGIDADLATIDTALHRSAGFVCDDCFRLIGSRHPIGEIRRGICCMSKNQIRRERKSVLDEALDEPLFEAIFPTVYNYAIKSC